MPRLITIADRIKKARALIQQARDLPVPAEFGKIDLGYIAQVRGLLQQARDLIKFIPQQPSATAENKVEVRKIFEEAEQAGKEILR